METKANYVLIGLFTLAIVAGVFGFVYWFQHIGGTGERVIYQVIFDGSVSGLRTGGSVLFNGIRVGEVTELKLSAEHPKRVVAVASVDKSTPVRADTAVGLEFQGLTGIAALSLRGGTASAPALAGSNGEPPTLIAPPGATQDVTEAAREALRRLDSFLADNTEVFHSALKNIDTFSAALARNSDRIDHIVAGLEDLTGGADGKTGAIRQLVDSLDKRTAEISAGINRFSNSGSREIETLSTDARRTLGEIERAVRNLDRNPSRIIFGGSGATVPEYSGRR